MPLDFLEFVTDGRFLDIVPLGGFRKKGISKGDVIRFFGVCNRRAVSGHRAIRWFLQRRDFEGRCH